MLHSEPSTENPLRRRQGTSRENTCATFSQRHSSAHIRELYLPSPLTTQHPTTAAHSPTRQCTVLSLRGEITPPPLYSAPPPHTHLSHSGAVYSTHTLRNTCSFTNPLNVWKFGHVPRNWQLLLLEQHVLTSLRHSSRPAVYLFCWTGNRCCMCTSVCRVCDMLGLVAHALSSCLYLLSVILFLFPHNLSLLSYKRLNKRTVSKAQTNDVYLPIG